MDTRLSPLHDCIAALNPRWVTVNGMRVPAHIPGERADLSVQLSDASCLPRMGLKGARAQTWLEQRHIHTPDNINSWVHSADGVRVARLARSEFFLEDRVDGSTVMALRDALTVASGVSPVLRQDAALVLFGEKANDLLVQTCNVNLRAWRVEERTVVMTSMIGVSVLVLWEPFQGQPRYRVWCDHTFGPYLWDTLLEIARELGGGAVGVKSLIPDPPG